eukprot:7245443-Prymnesium_polylepis.1
MRARGLDWVVTDAVVSPNAVSAPLCHTAEEAVLTMGPPFDVCFWSWWIPGQRVAATAVMEVAASATAAF